MVIQRKPQALASNHNPGRGTDPEDSEEEDTREDQGDNEDEDDSDEADEEDDGEEGKIGQASYLASVPGFRDRHRITVQLHSGVASAIEELKDLYKPMLSFDELDIRNVPIAFRDVCCRCAAASASEVAEPRDAGSLRPTAVQAECWGLLLMPSEKASLPTPVCDPVVLPAYNWDLSAAHTTDSRWHEAEAIAIPSDDESDDGNGSLSCKVRESHDVIAIAPTGSGKTLAYLLPLVADGLCSNSSGIVDLDDMFDQFERLFPASFPLEREKNATLLQQVRKLREKRSGLGFLCQVSSKAQEGANKAKVAEWQSFSNDCALVGLVLPQALVLLPTRELAFQVAHVAKSLGSSSCAVIGGVDPDRQREQMLSELPSLVIATPGRLRALCGQVPSSTRMRQLQKDGTEPKPPARSISLSRLSRLVLDEGDRLLDEGFEEDILALAILATKRRLTMLFSATWSSEIHTLSKVLREGAVHITVEGVPKSITQRVEYLPKASRGRRLRELLKEFGPSKVLVFVLYQAEAKGLAKMLVSEGWSAWALQGKMSQAARTSALQSFREAEHGMLVATDVAARGLDVAGITHVVNFSLGLSIDTYVHRIGRCGRAGHKGMAVTFVTDGDQRHCPSLLQVLQRSRQPVPDWLPELAQAGESKRPTSVDPKSGQPSEEELEARKANADKQALLKQRKAAKQAQELRASNARWTGRRPVR